MHIINLFHTVITLRYISFSIIFLICISTVLIGQTKTDLEEKRKQTLAEIDYVDNLLKTTTSEKVQSINAIRIINRKIVLRESVITGMDQEIFLLTNRIDLNTLAIGLMEKDLGKLKNDYTKAVINSYRYQKFNRELIYILSAKDFNQGYKRLKYLQQIAKFRRGETEIIAELKNQIVYSRERLQNDLIRISDIKSKEQQQKNLLSAEQQKKQKMVNSLSSKEKQLKKEWEEKQKIAQRLEKEIAKIIEAERKNAAKSDISPEQRLIGENFADNKGRLPWPVEKGIITSHFGIHQNPILKNLTEKNIGIEITSNGKTKVRSVFQGEVAIVSSIQGQNMTVIIRHGNYRSVYTNIINITVKAGDKVTAGQYIGEVYSDPADNYNSIVKFMIFESEYLDPESWIIKN